MSRIYKGVGGLSSQTVAVVTAQQFSGEPRRESPVTKRECDLGEKRSTGQARILEVSPGWLRDGWESAERSRRVRISERVERRFWVLHAGEQIGWRWFRIWAAPCSRPPLERLRVGSREPGGGCCGLTRLTDPDVCVCVCRVFSLRTFAIPSGVDVLGGQGAARLFSGGCHAQPRPGSIGLGRCTDDWSLTHPTAGTGASHWQFPPDSTVTVPGHLPHERHFRPPMC